ncbi:hypothetical protein C446_04455 [Halobiforma nitratireducens JCM 10879]|uniref:Uncharacterized protein n=1 Tax=Halobiforma nitratireducens JCM 10879 TaxID=1227454 RepID=M0M994_9EURY|nr:hypothetical protein C446_04455 [Halobiforma nitratireducens JCM 10879]
MIQSYLVFLCRLENFFKFGVRKDIFTMKNTIFSISYIIIKPNLPRIDPLIINFINIAINVKFNPVYRIREFSRNQIENEPAFTTACNYEVPWNMKEIGCLHDFAGLFVRINTTINYICLLYRRNLFNSGLPKLGGPSIWHTNIFSHIKTL